MTIHEEKGAGYITLKEASERFGYAPDYIGQLIRKGKIEGKQVYANVAWMTTEEAMMEYVSALSSPTGEKRTGKGDTSPYTASPRFSVDHLISQLFTEKMMCIYTWVMRGVFLMLLVALVFVFYFLSIVIDRKLTKTAELRAASVEISVNERLTYEQHPKLSYER